MIVTAYDNAGNALGSLETEVFSYGRLTKSGRLIHEGYSFRNADLPVDRDCLAGRVEVRKHETGSVVYSFDAVNAKNGEAIHLYPGDILRLLGFSI